MEPLNLTPAQWEQLADFFSQELRLRCGAHSQSALSCGFFASIARYDKSDWCSVGHGYTLSEAVTEALLIASGVISCTRMKTSNFEGPLPQRSRRSRRQAPVVDRPARTRRLRVEDL